MVLVSIFSEVIHPLNQARKFFLFFIWLCKIEKALGLTCKKDCVKYTFVTTPLCIKNCKELEKVSFEQLSAENTLPCPTRFLASQRLRSSKAWLGVPLGFVCCSIEASGKLSQVRRYL